MFSASWSVCRWFLCLLITFSSESLASHFLASNNFLTELSVKATDQIRLAVSFYIGNDMNKIKDIPI